MGTRHLIAVQFNGEYKVAQYGQWDGYPEGQGKAVLNFLRDEKLFDKLKTNLGKCRFIEDDEVDRLNDLLNKSDAKTVNWYHDFCSRDLGAKVLENIAGSTDNEILLIDRISFAKDGLFCEWAYVVDLDKNTFEVYKGFGKTELSPEERFYDAEFKSGNEYQPVRLRATFSLDALPDDDEFYSSLECKVDENEDCEDEKEVS